MSVLIFLIFTFFSRIIDWTNEWILNPLQNTLWISSKHITDASLTMMVNQITKENKLWFVCYSFYSKCLASSTVFGQLLKTLNISFHNEKLKWIVCWKWSSASAVMNSRIIVLKEIFYINFCCPHFPTQNKQQTKQINNRKSSKVATETVK